MTLRGVRCATACPNSWPLRRLAWAVFGLHAPVKIADSKPNGGLHPLGAGLVETIEAETTVRYARTFELCAGAPVGWKPLLGGDPC